MAKKSLVDRDNKYENTKFWIEDGIDLESRTVMISGPIDEDMIDKRIRAIHKMIELDDESPIDVIIKSGGGNITDGLALYDMLRSLNYLTVRTFAVGRVCSIALIIYLAGDERYASENVRFMHHLGTDELEGSKYSLKNELREVEKLEKICDDIVATNTTKTDSWWQKKIEKIDFWFGKEEAVELGIVTHSGKAE